MYKHDGPLLTYTPLRSSEFIPVARKAFGLTEQEILTLPHESIMASPKTFFLYKDVKELAIQKFLAGAYKSDVGDPRLASNIMFKYVRTFTKTDYKPKLRTRLNWLDNESESMRFLEMRLGLNYTVEE